MVNNKKVILSTPQQKDIVNQFLQTKSLEITSRFGVYYLEPGNYFSSLPKHVEAIVFQSAFNNEEELLYDEFLHYNSVSSFILVIDHQHQLPVGMMRVIKSSVDAIKTLTTISLPPWSHAVDDILARNNLNNSLNHICDVSTLAILPEYRYSSGLCIGLCIYLALSKYGQKNNIKYYLALLDDKAFRVLENIGFPVSQLQGTMQCSYLGSECTIPAYIDHLKFESSVKDNLSYIKKIKLLSMIAAKHISYEKIINPEVEKWLTSYEKYTYPLAKYIPDACLNLILYKNKKSK